MKVFFLFFYINLSIFQFINLSIFQLFNFSIFQFLSNFHFFPFLANSCHNREEPPRETVRFVPETSAFCAQGPVLYFIAREEEGERATAIHSYDLRQGCSPAGHECWAVFSGIPPRRVMGSDLPRRQVFQTDGDGGGQKMNLTLISTEAA